MKDNRKPNCNFPKADCNLKTKDSWFFADLLIKPVVNITVITNLKVIQMFTYLKELLSDYRRVNLKAPDVIYIILLNPQ